MESGCRLLKTPGELVDARILLKQVYCDEMGWMPPLDNPINHRIVYCPISSADILQDDYDHLCSWIGAYHNNQLVGVARMRTCAQPIHELDKHLVVANRQDLLDLLPKLYTEINRITVRKEYSHLGIERLLVGFGIKLGCEKYLPIVVTTYVMDCYIGRYIGRYIGSIKYEPNTSNIFVIDHPIKAHALISKL